MYLYLVLLDTSRTSLLEPIPHQKDGPKKFYILLWYHLIWFAPNQLNFFSLFLS